MPGSQTSPAAHSSTSGRRSQCQKRCQRSALAAFHIHDDLSKAALARSVTVLRRRGDVIETLAA